MKILRNKLKLGPCDDRKASHARTTITTTVAAVIILVRHQSNENQMTVEVSVHRTPQLKMDTMVPHSQRWLPQSRPTTTTTSITGKRWFVHVEASKFIVVVNQINRKQKKTPAVVNKNVS